MARRIAWTCLVVAALVPTTTVAAEVEVLDLPVELGATTETAAVAATADLWNKAGRPIAVPDSSFVWFDLGPEAYSLVPPRPGKAWTVVLHCRPRVVTAETLDAPPRPMTALAPARTAGRAGTLRGFVSFDLFNEGLNQRMSGQAFEVVGFPRGTVRDVGFAAAGSDLLGKMHVVGNQTEYDGTITIRAHPRVDSAARVFELEHPTAAFDGKILGIPVHLDGGPQLADVLKQLSGPLWDLATDLATSREKLVASLTRVLDADAVQLTDVSIQELAVEPDGISVHARIAGRAQRKR